MFYAIFLQKKPLILYFEVLITLYKSFNFLPPINTQLAEALIFLRKHILPSTSSHF